MHAAFHRSTDRYSEWALIGEGGTARVFRVHDRDLGIPLAVKILRPELCADHRQVDAMRREVLISRALRHPNICPVHDLYEGPHGIGVIMDLLAGRDLKQWIAAHRGRLLETLSERLLAFRRIAEALSVAHSRIIHRDLKPANIFLQDGEIGRPLIMDFGLSLHGNAGNRTFAGGTPKYMAPEQYLAPESVDCRTDLFSLGILAYEMLTDGMIPESSLRNLPVARQAPQVSGAGLTPPSRFCAAIPPALDRLVLQLVDSDPRNRPDSADEIVEALAHMRIGEATVPRKGGALGPMVAVPGGAYAVGLRRPGRTGLRRATLSPYRIGAHPVTNAEYARFVAATGMRAPPFSGHPQFGHADAPVVGVSWSEAAAYAEWVGGRLPSEAEWEVAAKAGADEAEYPWGAEPPLVTRANIDRICPHTTPVESYPAGRNAWGLSDMCGNVWEWCADPWEEALFRRIAEGESNPTGRGDGALRPLRGGSFDSFAATGRCAFRSKEKAGERRADVGFRVASGPDDGG